MRICAIAVKFVKSSAEPVESLIVSVVVKVAPWSINIFDIDAIHTVSFYLFIRKVRWSYATKNPLKRQPFLTVTLESPLQLRNGVTVWPVLRLIRKDDDIP